MKGLKTSKKGEKGGQGEVFGTMKQRVGLELRSKEEAVLQDTFDGLKLENATNWK